ncbi:GAF and ANTAR domain-containing protein [Mycobacterium sp.]|jgi:GAF domain-containing protein|uniref:GAF and ANTAR domain-containing protein n=1 Tax=Mycobacterium sp. TaxID=1785 RepID=UPI002D621CA8|nr:GAF and ANTAR domain-containing protein [Mycobacterium sp.]HZA10706.1 GAF and ANTAR domain-containing protein [Mycobacterium sp.]
MAAGPDEAHLTHHRIADIVRELHARAEPDADTVIAELAEHAAVEIPGAQYAGITITRDHKHIDTPAATHRYPMLLDKIQQRYGEGPCLTSAWDEKTIEVSDLEHDARWPAYRRDALAETPIRSIMAFQLFIADQTMGALNVYADEPGAFGEESKTIGLIFAAHTSVAWNAARRDQQFRKALASRDIIGQAKGMIMERYGVDAVQAFDMLRKLSQDSNTAVTQIAADLVRQANPSTS